MKGHGILFPLLTLAFAMIFCSYCYADDQPFKLKKSASTETKVINETFVNSDSISFSSEKNLIEGFAITGKVIQTHPNSFVRVLLEDKDRNEYVILESSKLYNDVDTLIISDYCEETKTLPYIYPYALRIYMNNASLELSNITWNISDINSKTQKKQVEKQKEISDYNRRIQTQSIANRINENNCIHKRLWRASNTELSMMPWAERKKLMGIDGNCPPSGFEYYTSGIFEFGEADFNQDPRGALTVSPYVDSFDWRNRHGVNWMTSVKRQTGNRCWAFTAVGVTEALVNLYFNSKIDCDLSEQEVISCSGCSSSNGGGHAYEALKWIADNGVSEEASFIYSGENEPCSNKGYFNELITLGDTGKVANYTTNNNDEVKRMLIKNGPMVSGHGYVYMNSDTIIYYGHAMPLVGYAVLHAGDTIEYYNDYLEPPIYSDVIQSGDSRIGKTYWIFKNSYGPNIQHQGYAYVLFNDPFCFLTPYYAILPVSSLLYSDSDIVVEDLDGDGFYNWGIGPKPAHCPSWVPDTPDGDDSDYEKGPMDEYGYLMDIPDAIPDSIIYITQNTVWSNRKYVYHNVYVNSGKTLRITNDINFYRGVTLNLASGSKLIVDGATLTDVDINYIGTTGTSIQILHNGTIKCVDNQDFVVPLGVTLDIDYGKIN